MLQLNGTVLVQAVHVLVAYLIIDRILFRQAVQELAADQQEKKQLRDAVQYEANGLKQLQHERETLWHQTQIAFSKRMPTVKRFAALAEPRELPAISMLSAHHIKQVIQKSVEAVIKEVADVD